jgi:hypothetical protein
MNLFSPNWWINMFINVFVTMVFIYLIKKFSNQYNIPVVKDVANGV